MLLSKNRVIRRRAVVGLLVAASLTLLTMSYREGSTGVVGSMQRGATAVTAPVAGVAHRVTRPFVDGWHWMTGLVNARDQTARLKVDETKLGLLASKIKDLQAQNADLQRLANWVQRNPQYHGVSGSVIMQSPDVAAGTVTLGIGSDQGVRMNDTVVAPASDGGGLVGRVSQVTGGTATVQVLLDPSTGVTAQVQGEQGAIGTIVPAAGSPGELTMEQVPTSARVRNGDTVITTGFGDSKLRSIYPAGIPIGRVTEVHISDSNGTSSQIQVTPFVDFSTLNGVVVLETH
jgi:rod shape-determining protein MreC